MTVIYCGSCGVANGAQAKFCRQCGADLSAQTARRSVAEANPAAGAAARLSSPKTNSTTTPKPQLRIVTPSAKGAVEPKAEATPELRAETKVSANQSAKQIREATRQKRETQRIVQQQEEDARQIKQAVAGSLSQRLAQAPTSTSDTSKPLTAGPAAPNSGKLATASFGTPSGPRVRMAPTPTQANAKSGKLADAAAKTRKITQSTSSAVAEASGLHEHPKAGLYIRVVASVLGLLLLISGVYFYRQQNNNAVGGAAGNRNLLSSGDESAKLVKVAEEARQKGENEAAAETLTKAIELTPNHPEPRQMLAETYETAGRQDEALKAYDGLLKVAPENLSARLKYAELHRAKGNVIEARSQYQRIISLNQHSPEATRAAAALEEIDNTLAQMAAASGTPFNSRPRRVAGQKRIGPVLPPSTDASEQVTLIPQNPFALPNSRSLFNANPVRPVEAPDPKMAAAHHKEQGTNLYNRRQFGAAIGEFQQALKFTPNDKDLYYFLGGSYYGLGQPSKAYEYYKKCDSGQYAATAQNGAERTKKAAQKEYDRQQKELLNSTQSEKTKQPTAGKDTPSGKGLQNSFQEF